jgi:transposase-like protein
MGQRRVYTAKFKVDVVLAALKGEKTAAQMCREHSIGQDLLSRWRQQFLAGAPQVFTQEAIHSAEQVRIAELERLVGQLTMELDVSKTLSALWEPRCRTSAR